MKMSKSEEIIARLKAEGKVKTIEWPAELQKKFDDLMTEVRRESRYKQAMSEIEASKVILNA